MPLGQIPVLKTETSTIAQTNAIINWAVRNGDLPGLSCEEASKSDMVVETCREIFDTVRMTAFIAMQAADSRNTSVIDAANDSKSVGKDKRQKTMRFSDR